MSDTTKKKRTFDFSDLDKIDFNAEAAAAAPNGAKTESDGTPLKLSLALIKPDPNQPRKVFTPDALQELADSIKEHGIKTPISVKPRNAEGVYIINYGERRWRAAGLAGLDSVPAFIDDTHDVFAQMVENIQRDDLKPMEIADFIAQQLAEGLKQKDIVQKLRKSRQWVSQFAAIGEAPEIIKQAARSGLLNSFDAIYALVKFLEQNPDELDAVQNLLTGTEPVTQAEVRAFVASYKAPKSVPNVPLTEQMAAGPAKQESTTGSDTEGKNVPLTEQMNSASEPRPIKKETAASENRAEMLAPRFTEPTETPTRTSTDEEQEAAAEQHATDSFFRAAHQDDNEDKGSTPKTSSSKNDGTRKETAIHSGFDQERGEQAEKEQREIQVTEISKPLLMFTKGSRGGSVNLNVSTDFGYVMVRYEGANKDTQEDASQIKLTALIEG